MIEYAPAPYVFIGFTQESIDLFRNLIRSPTNNKGSVGEDLVKNFMEDESVLFTNYSNPNFISFTHGQGFGSEAVWTMKLELIDPTEKLEEQITKSSILPAALGSSSQQREEFEKQGSGVLAQSFPNDNIDGLYEKFLNDKVKSFVLENTNKKYYITYGVGSDIETWAGPFVAYLTGAEIQYSEFKKVILTFSPTPNPVAIQNKVSVSPTNNDYFVRPANLREQVTGDSKTIYLSNIINNKEIKSIYPSNANLEKSELFDFHSMVVDIIKSILRQITGKKNVIVLLPNLNLLFSQTQIKTKINDITKEQIEDSIKLLVSSKEITNPEIIKLSESISSCTKIHKILEYLAQQTSLGFHSYEENNIIATQTNLTTSQHEQNNDKLKGIFSTRKEFFEKNTFYLRKNITQYQDDKPIDYSELLKKFIDDLYYYLPKLRPQRTILFYETNVNILNAWESYVGTSDPIFGDLSEIKDSSIVVFGDPLLIARLYAYRLPKDENIKTKPTSEGGSEQFNSIHPNDRIILDQSYLDILSQYSRKRIKTGPFSPSETSPDLFEYAAYKTGLGPAQISNFPIFKYNLPDPNILKIKAFQQSIYFSELATGYVKELSKKATKHLIGPYDEKSKLNPFLNEAAVLSYIEERLAKEGSYNVVASKIQADLLQNYEANKTLPGITNNLPQYLTETSKSEYISALILKKIKEARDSGYSFSKVRILDFDFNDPAFSPDVEQKLDATTRSLILQIETLPYFSLSDNSINQTPCLVFAKSPQLMHTDLEKYTQQSLDLNYMDFVSNVYVFIGFKHTIRIGKLSSEFLLARNLGKTGVEEK